MTDAPDGEPSAHRSHKAPKSVRNLLKRLGFKPPEQPKESLNGFEDE